MLIPNARARIYINIYIKTKTYNIDIHNYDEGVGLIRALARVIRKITETKICLVIWKRFCLSGRCYVNSSLSANYRMRLLKRFLAREDL